MSRFLVPFVAALLGAALGAGVATRLSPARDVPAESTPIDLGDVRADLAALRARLDPPGGGGLAMPFKQRGVGGPTSEEPAPAPSPTGDSPAVGATADTLETVVARAVETALERRAEAERAAKAEAEKPKIRRPLAEVARELGLSPAQESEVRAAYRNAVDRMLKVLAEPESDAETLRRELDDARGDRGKGMAVVARHMPKFLSKIGDVMAIQAERDQRIHAALGPEHVESWVRYRVEEEDPFGLSGDVSVGVGTSGR